MVPWMLLSLTGWLSASQKINREKRKAMFFVSTDDSLLYGICREAGGKKMAGHGTARFKSLL